MAATMEKSRAQSTMYRPRRNSISPPPTMSLRVVLLGKTGSGKSASGNTILRREAFKVEFSSESVTETCSNQHNVVDGTQITVIDTPGLFDTEKPMEELKGELEKCVEMSPPGPHAFLLVIRLGVRFTEEERNAVKLIQENFGEGALKYTIVLLTHGDVLEGTVEDFLSKNHVLSSLIKQVRGRYHVFNNKSEDSTQVTELTKKIEAMVEENGGSNYTSEMFKEVQGKIREKEEREREQEEKGKAEEETKKKELEMERRKRRDAEMKANEEKKRADEAMKRAWEETQKKEHAEREQKKNEDEVRCMKKIVEMSVGTAVGIGGLGVVAATVGGVVAVASGGGETAAAAVAAVAAGGGAGAAAAAAVEGAVAAVVAVAAGAAAAAAAAAVGGVVAAVAAGGGAAAAVAAAAVGAAGGGVIAVAAALAGAATATAGGAAALVAAAVAGAVVGAAAVAIGRQIC